MTHTFIRQTVTLIVILMLGFLVAHKAINHANANASTGGGMSCSERASAKRAESLANGFSKAGAFAQAENVLARCLIDR